MSVKSDAEKILKRFGKNASKTYSNASKAYEGISKDVAKTYNGLSKDVTKRLSKVKMPKLSIG